LGSALVGGAVAGGVTDFLNQAMSGEPIDWIHVGSSAGLGLAGGGLLKVGLPATGRLPEIWAQRTLSNLKTNSIKLLWRELGADELGALENKLISLVHSVDPNDIVGPASYGAQNFVSASAPQTYRIDFENAASATAPAQTITTRRSRCRARRRSTPACSIIPRPRATTSRSSPAST
jgi:hypothetical protein